MPTPRRFLALLAAAILLCAMSLTAFAHEVPDLSRKGSIQLTMRQGTTPVSGGSVTLYRVGAVQEEDGNYRFVLTSDFAGSKVSLEELQSAQLAKTLAGYAGKQGLTGITQEVDRQGKVSFADLDLGLYLLVQNKAAKGYQKAAPFLVSVPMEEEGALSYDVDASPKVEIEKEPEPTSTTPPTPTDPRLPYTGQLNWPVPVLVVLGLGLLLLGFALRRKSRHG